MIVRRLTDSDALAQESVASSAFIYAFDPEKVEKLEHDYMLGAFNDEGVMMACLEVYDYKNYFGKGTLGCAGVGGVASKPEFRRGGAVRAMFNYLFEDAPKQGWDISILYPFSEEYYQKFGYSAISNKMYLEADFRCLEQIPRCSGAVLYDGSQSEALYELYNKIARKYSLAFMRNSDKYFNTNYPKDLKFTYLWKNDKGEFKAYVNCEFNRAESKVIVQEIGFIDKEGMLGILGFLRVFDGNYKTIVFHNLPQDTPIYPLLTNLSMVTRKLINNGSVRVFNLKKVLELNVYPKEKGSFVFESTDEITKGVYSVKYENSAAEISVSESGKPDFIMDSIAISRYVVGGVSGGFEALSYDSHIEVVNENEDFLKAFPKRNTFFTDGF